MAFATNPSAFGIKPATTGGAFGAQSTQASGSNPSPSPFGAFGGSSSQQPAQQQPSLFGGSTPGQNQSQPQGQSQPSIFGQQQQPQSSGGLFGSSQPTQSGFGSWGQNNQQQNQQQLPTGFSTGGNIFGNPSGQQQNQQQPSTGFGTSNIFGNTNGQQQDQQQPSTTGFGTGGSIFGNTGGSQQTQQQPPTGLGLGGSIFGNPGGQQQQQGGSLWGSTAVSNTAQSITSQFSGVLGASQQQAPPVLTRTTRFNDLPEQVQKTLESIDAYIQGRIQISSELKARSLDEAPTKGAELIRKVHNDLVNTMSTLQADKGIAEELRSKVDESVQDTIITTRIMDGFRNPQQNGAYLKNHANFPLEFFTRAADEIRQKLQWYKTTIEQIERRLASAQNAMQYNPQAITATLQAQNSTFIALAGKTAELDAELLKIKSIYRELWRTHTGSARDPFNEFDRRSGDGGRMLNGIGSLNLSR